ncbi:MAG: ribosome-associated GTPase [Myxococcaceae bacterium]|nr:ribosome-associated GTPase [Myxococcaceae bacterium]
MPTGLVIPPRVVDAVTALGEVGLEAARVIRFEADRATVLTAETESIAVVPRRVASGGEHTALVPGDWVAHDPSQAVVRHVLARTSELARQAVGRRTERQIVAANIDIVFLVTSLDADFSTRRLERYLTLSHESGAKPVVVLTKLSIAERAEERLAEARAVARAVTVHAVDTLDGTNLDAIRAYLEPGITIGLVGSSGVGKSTLVNHLLGEARIATAEVREGDGKGRHTTTRRELFVLPNGAAILDTPGMRELALWASTESLDVTFDDIEALAADCRFRDCVHKDEPGCAVREAAKSGALEPDRYTSYLALRRELAAHEARLEGTRRATDRAGSRMVREALRDKGRK